MCKDVGLSFRGATRRGTSTCGKAAGLAAVRLTVEVPRYARNDNRCNRRTAPGAHTWMVWRRLWFECLRGCALHSWESLHHAPLMVGAVVHGGIVTQVLRDEVIV